MGKFVIKKVPTGIRFDLKASNGEVICNSEVYTTRPACLKGIASITKNAPIAPIEDQTQPDFKVEKHPKFEVFTDKNGDIRFRLKARNGKIIAASEPYKSLKNCLSGIESVKKNAADSETVEAE